MTLPSFETMLTDPHGQHDQAGELLPHLLAFGTPQATPDAMISLCGSDGMVRSGAMHHGTDYPCTGGAHFAGAHIVCANPLHIRASTP